VLGAVPGTTLCQGWQACGLLLYLQSPRHCHVHGGRRGHYGGTCAETPSKTRPALLYTVYRAIVVASMCCCWLSCMHVYAVSIVLSTIILPSCSMCRRARPRARTRMHAAVALGGNRCSLLLPSTASVAARPPITPAGAGSGSVALNDLPRLPSLPAYAKDRLACPAPTLLCLLAFPLREAEWLEPRNATQAPPALRWLYRDYEYQPSLQPSLSLPPPSHHHHHHHRHPPPSAARVLQLALGYCSQPTRSFVSARQ
jgi:hypothetical protein